MGALSTGEAQETMVMSEPSILLPAYLTTLNAPDISRCGEYKSAAGLRQALPKQEE
jgi:hypothetical protein